MERKRTKNNKPISKTSNFELKFSMIEKDNIKARRWPLHISIKDVNINRYSLKRWT